MKAMTRRLHRMTVDGPLDREKTRTVIAVWKYWRQQRWTPSRR